MELSARAGTARDIQIARYKSIALMCAAVLLFSLLDTVAKYLSDEFTSQQVVWARYACHMLFTLFLFRPRTLIAQLSSERPWLQIARGFLLAGATYGNFFAVRYLQLTETVSIFFLAPLLVTALAIVFLGEKVGLRRWAAIVVGFLGVMIVVRPGFGGLHWAVIFSFASVTSYAGYTIITRLLAPIDRPETSLLFSALVGFVISTPVAIFGWVTPDSIYDIGLFLLMGLCGAVGHYMLILAHQNVEASVLAPFSFTAIIWMTLTGYYVFGDIPGLTTIIGAAVVISSGLYLLNRERAQKS